MRKEFPGYYRPTEDEFKDLWASAIVVPDTNVLLTLYRLSEETRQRLLGIFEALTDRLFLSHQVAAEFQERRFGVIEEQKKVYTTVLGLIGAFPEKVGSELREHPRLDPDELKRRLKEALAPVEEYVEGIRGRHPDPLSDNDAIGPDSIRDVLDKVFADKVGPPRDLDRLKQEGAVRYGEERPPGYKDKGKGEPRCYGDLAIWLDTIDAAKAQSKDVIFVTADRKADWWWVEEGKIIAPRPELSDEMREKAEQSVYLYDIERFMEEGSKALGLEDISEAERNDVARAQKPFFATTTLADGVDLSQYEFDPPQVHWDTKSIEWPVPSSIDHSKFIYVGASNSLRWHTFTEALSEHRVRINLRLQPTLFFPKGTNEARHISCLVDGPDGTKSEALLSESPLDANVTFPDDFVGVPGPEDGMYRYRWSVVGARGLMSIPDGEVASGVFQLGAGDETPNQTD